MGILGEFGCAAHLCAYCLNCMKILMNLCRMSLYNVL